MIDDTKREMVPDAVSLIDEEGNEYEFEVLAVLDYKENRRYYALAPMFELEEGEDPNVYMIFEAIEDENGDLQLAEVESEELLEEVAVQFDEIFARNEEE